MNHFANAREECIKVASDPSIQALAKRICLIFDIQGRIRVLADLDDNFSNSRLQEMLDPLLTSAAHSFWTRKFWFDRTNQHDLGKPSPSEKALFDKVWEQAKPSPSAPAFSFVLDRHYSKEGWFDTHTEAPWPYREQKTPPIISFYSYKGGVGRTTALASLAIQWSRQGRKVLLVDFDLEAPGLASVFPPPQGVHVDVGVVDYLLEHPVVGNQFPVGELIYVFDDRAVVGSGEIRVVPAGRIDSWYLEKLSRIDYGRLVDNSIDSATASISGSQNSPMHELLNALRRQEQPDLVLLDSRAGLHDLGGLALSSLSHWHVLFGLDSPQSWDGLKLAIGYLGRKQVETGRIQRDCLLVQSMVPPQEGRQPSTERFRHQAYEAFCADYYDTASPGAEWPVPDELDTDQPHYPVSLLHDNKVMGYSMVQTVADYLCEGEFHKLHRTLTGKLGLPL
jgi:hypothetical protein